MEYRYGRSDIKEISIRISIWDRGYRYGHPGYRYGIRLMIWEMTLSIRSSPISIWDIVHTGPGPAVKDEALLAVVLLDVAAHVEIESKV
jgi:hypothetical protein